MQRLFLFSAIVGIAVISVIALVALALTYGLDTPPKTIAVPGLSDAGTITLFEAEYPPLLNVQDENLYPALGALHGTRSLWQAILLRQVAQGKMMVWLGAHAEEIDRATLSLDLEHRSRLAFATLPEEDQLRLVAFAQGFNAAMRKTALSDRFMSLLSITPEPWEPWHSLLIERLWLWLASDIDVASADAVPAVRDALNTVESQRTLIRQTLALHGFEDQVQWLSTQGDTTLRHVRYVLGSSALPWLTEVQLPNQRYLLQLPGTPFTLAFFSRDEASAYLPAARAQLRWVSTDAPTSVRKRTLTLSDGTQETIPLTFYEDALRLTRMVLTSETGLEERDLVLSWSGYSSRTDAPVFMRVSPDYNQLHLFSPQDLTGQRVESGLVVREHPTGWVYGAPVVSEAIRQSITERDAVGHSLLDALLRPYSASQYQRATQYADALSVLPKADSAQLVAYTYLRGWDGQYDPSSIGATVFTSVEAQLQRIGTVGDSLRPQALHQAFAHAVSEITARHGDSPLEWRWEKAFTPALLFPLWGDGTQLTLPARIWRLYTPLSVLALGSPYALRYGPSPTQRIPASASLEITWIRERTQTQVLVRRTGVNVNTFMGRYLYEFRERYPAPVWSANQGDVRIIRLVPTS